MHVICSTYRSCFQRLHVWVLGGGVCVWAGICVWPACLMKLNVWCTLHAYTHLKTCQISTFLMLLRLSTTILLLQHIYNAHRNTLIYWTPASHALWTFGELRRTCLLFKLCNKKYTAHIHIVNSELMQYLQIEGKYTTTVSIKKISYKDMHDPQIQFIPVYLCS